MESELEYSAFLPANIGIFTPGEAKEIIRIGLSRKMNQAVLASSDGNITSPPEDIRQSNVSWLNPYAWDTSWIYRRLYDRVKIINEQYFKFNITGFQPFQFTEYDSNYKGHYNWHYDGMRDNLDPKLIRKLSVAIPLVDSKEYTGGEFMVKNVDASDVSLEQTVGHGIVFPSFLLHKVTPVTKGTRYSLVAWCTGPDFI